MNVDRGLLGRKIEMHLELYKNMFFGQDVREGLLRIGYVDRIRQTINEKIDPQMRALLADSQTELCLWEQVVANGRQHLAELESLIGGEDAPEYYETVSHVAALEGLKSLVMGHIPL